MTDAKVDAYMPLWIGAYLADTLTFTTAQHGAYLLLLMAYWRERAPLADDDEDLAGITKLSRNEWKNMRPKLAKKFQVADGVWRHKRVEQELAGAMQRKEKASSKAKGAAEARWGKAAKQCKQDAPSMPGALLEDCPTTPPTPFGGIEPSGSTPPGPAADLPPTGEYEPPADAHLPGLQYARIAGRIRQAGIGSLDPGYPAFRALVDAGATADEFTGFVAEALTKDQPFKWLIGAVSGERKRAAVLATQLHRGPMPNKQEAIEQRNAAVGDAWLAEQGAA